MFPAIFASPLYEMNRVVSQVTTELSELNSRLITVNDLIGRLISKASSLNVITNEQTDIDARRTQRANLPTASTKNTVAEDAITVTKGLTEMASSGIKVYETFEKLSHAMEKVKKGVGAVSGVVELAGGIEAMSSATGFVDGIAALGSIVGGAGEVIALLSGLGEVGLVIGAGILVAGGIAAIANMDWQPKKGEQPTFADVAAANGNPYLLKQERSRQQANFYVAASNLPVSKSDAEIVKEAERLKNEFLKKGGVVEFDWRRGEGTDPAYLMGVVNAMRENFQMKTHPIKQLLFDDEKDMKAFRSNFDIFSQFPLATRPYIMEPHSFYFPKRADGPAQTVSANVVMSKKEYDKKHMPAPGVKTVIDYINDGLVAAAVAESLTAGKKLTDSRYKSWLQKYSYIPGFKQYAQPLYDRYQKARNLADKDKATGQPTFSVSGKNENADRENSKVINVNINRSLIGNFTVQTTDAKDGINRLKHEVEQALLEVLNAANSIN